MLTEAAGKGLLQLTPDDDAPLDGRTISLNGRSVVSFGSCSYLGLELDPRLQQATIDAVLRYGTQFSSSRGYLSSPQYIELEALLSELFGGHVLVTPTTSLGHLSVLPVLVDSTDAVLLDHQVHASVQMAANQLRVKGAHVDLVRHNNMERLEAMIQRLSKDHDRIWYMADGVYSMFADLAPFAELRALLDKYPQLWLYVDDSHGVGWAGQHGRGPALDVLGGHERVIAACSLNKSYAAAGGAIVFPDAELRRRVKTAGGPMMFSGPIQPPLLGAAIESAKIHLSDELPRMQGALRERVALFTSLCEEFGIPLATTDVTPIRYVPLGLPVVAHDVIKEILADGYYTNLGTFPAVPMKHAGVRMTITLHHTSEDIRGLVASLAKHVPAALERAGEAAKRRHAKIVGEHGPALTIEHHTRATALDEAEWNSLLGERGTFTVDGLKFLEDAFGGPGARPEDEWAFHYYVVRDRSGRAVLATFFTAALWKDDMMASAAVSELVEERRAQDPYYLTSTTFAMGSLLTEGDHLYLHRNADWKGALDLLMAAVGEDARAAGAGTIVFRDLHTADVELAEAVRERGYVRTSLPQSLVYEPVAGGDEAWLAQLSPKARVHQRKAVLPFDDAYAVEWLTAGGRAVSDAELDHLYELYLAVQAKGRDLNSFPLPKRFLRDMLAHPSWELMTLTLKEAGEVVAFGAHFVGPRHYAPMIVGLDYAYVRSHGAYRQALRHAVVRARELGSKRVLLGMGATFEKTRFGAHVQDRVAFAQASDHYSSEVLAALAADSHGH
ncbi:bifunctional aminotransferase class I/II-fold pyridoxal phosphate-dependent enzyme/GNAT family N-acetyltransferase [Solirubrobacter deserti]|uniref:8-amino-7-oxononanoate synthase n=1 Tax=Solirubrobacter deserti TaxID=2282478 RepID=A0ABT4RPF3_9ACTN|nr:bifunctional aminotransferase class I/II-fold pyridoxal phosphate-dependent enzyme/GNAT family N-acetyltransferase [Solirubrobacter deserti]MDA0140293.1 bifunctional aminotransferase class I/II-fold pyridoxal phosphate-dependent enzyme/GNAT family N-acetyltransferase [Solirubrobacter deserti]